MKLRSLYILSIVGLLLVIVVQIGGMMYAYDNTKKEAERALNTKIVPVDNDGYDFLQKALGLTV